MISRWFVWVVLMSVATPLFAQLESPPSPPSPYKVWDGVFVGNSDWGDWVPSQNIPSSWSYEEYLKFVGVEKAVFPDDMVVGNFTQSGMRLGYIQKAKEKVSVSPLPPALQEVRELPFSAVVDDQDDEDPSNDVWDYIYIAATPSASVDDWGASLVVEDIDLSWGGALGWIFSYSYGHSANITTTWSATYGGQLVEVSTTAPYGEYVWVECQYYKLIIPIT